MPNRREVGCVYAYSKGNYCWALRHDEYDRMKKAWMDGRAFFEGIGLHGEPVIIKLSQIEGLQHMHASSFATFQEESHENEKADAIHD